MNALENLLKYLPVNSQKHWRVHLIGPAKRKGPARKLSEATEGELIREYTRGLTLKEAGKKCDISPSLVRKTLQRKGVTLRRKGPRFMRNESTVYKVAKLMNKGLTQAEMAREIGCTPQRICQIVKRYY